MANTVDEYLSGFPKPTRDVLARVRGAIRKALPDAEESISYGIPVFKRDGRFVIYFAGWKAHYSLYPLNKPLERAFAAELERYEISGKGTVRFPLTEPVPVRLIQAIARFRATEVAETTGKQRPRKKR